MAGNPEFYLMWIILPLNTTVFAVLAMPHFYILTFTFYILTLKMGLIP